MSNSIELQQVAQREYYRRTANKYDALHYKPHDEHQFALSVLGGLLDFIGVTSILDIGSGTGRTLRSLNRTHPHIKVIGIEPSEALREQGYMQGLSPDVLIDGDATGLDYNDQHFDLVTEFATLHHIPRPKVAVREMLRVSRKAIFISDSNNFGQGSTQSRVFKSLIRNLGLWRTFDLVRTRGKGYMESEGDGLYYSYSVFQDYNLIKRNCKSVHIFNTLNSGKNLLFSAPQVALLGLKDDLHSN